MARTPIYDTPEYKLAADDKKGWAFTHKDNYISSADAAERMGLNLKDRSVKVKANDGTEIEVPVVISFHNITPSPKFKAVFTHLNNSHEYTTYYMIKGQSPKNKTAVYFTAGQFRNSPDTVALKKEIDDAFQLFHTKHHEMLKSELRKSHPPLAKKAADELPKLSKEDGAEEKIYKWFVDNKFQGIEHYKPKDFKSYAADIKKSGHVSSGFTHSAEEKYGHQQGINIVIDFANKKIGSHGWSSDD